MSSSGERGSPLRGMRGGRDAEEGVGRLEIFRSFEKTQGEKGKACVRIGKLWGRRRYEQ